MADERGAERRTEPEQGVRRPAERYGDRRAAWRRPASVLAVALVAAAGLAWVVWAGLHQANPPIRWSDVGYAVVDDSTTRVTFDVIADPGTKATCRVEALNGSYAVVGVAQVDVGPVDRQVTRQTADVVTQEPAVLGRVKSCDVR